MWPATPWGSPSIKKFFWVSMTNVGIELPLRLGCGLVNLYAGFHLLTNPGSFHKYVPDWLTQIVNTFASVDAYLRFQGLGELLIATFLLGWFLPRWCVRTASILLAAEMALILAFIGVDAVTFRNIGLAGAALALLISSYQEVEA